MPPAGKISLFITALTGTLACCGPAFAQSADTLSSFSITGYIDAYYAHYSDNVGAGNFQKFPVVSPRSDNPSLNTAQLSCAYAGEKVRATGVWHFGDIAAANWAPAPYNHIMEAHAGLKIYSKLWIDAGFFRGHFGTESLLPSENITTSLAVCSYYEPFFESGLRLNFVPVKKIEINLFLLNGYDVFTDNNGKKSLGIGVIYAPVENSKIGYTNYTGDETPDSIAKRHLRIHQNIFVNYQHNKAKLLAGADYCMQQNSDIASRSKMATMYSALFAIRYQLPERIAVYGRGEVFADPDGYMTGVITDKSGRATGLKLWGATAGIEYKPTEASYVRLEGRLLNMDKDQYIFITDGVRQHSRVEVMVNAGVTFDLLKNIQTRIINHAGDALIESGIK